MRKALALVALIMGLGACVNSPDGQTPEWADAQGYPSLREVPTEGTSAVVDSAHWDAVEADLLAARAAALASPRAQDAVATDDPEAFLEEARRELQETRNSHNPY
jgi:hypothetical protein